LVRAMIGKTAHVRHPACFCSPERCAGASGSPGNVCDCGAVILQRHSPLSHGAPGTTFLMLTTFSGCSRPAQQQIGSLPAQELCRKSAATSTACATSAHCTGPRERRWSTGHAERPRRDFRQRSAAPWREANCREREERSAACVLALLERCLVGLSPIFKGAPAISFRGTPAISKRDGRGLSRAGTGPADDRIRQIVCRNLTFRLP